MDEHRSNIIRYAGFAIVLAAIVAAVAAYAGFFAAPVSRAESERVIVPLNAGTAAAIQKIYTEGFIKSPLGFSLVWRWKGTGAITPGGYKLSKNMNAFEVAAVLAEGPYMKWVVIPEGLRKEEILDILAGALGWDEGKRAAWLDATNVQSEYVEGVYFPETYLIPIDESPAAVAERFQTTFEGKMAPFTKEALKQNIKWTTLLKLASIVQREAAGTRDMALIAGILWNRLLRSMPLDVDATLQYARGNTGRGWWAPITLADKKIDSPYNTYMHAGLPPHPISNPGVEAIDAALHPAQTDCLYYLHDASKIIHCAKTYEEHQQNIATYLK